MPGFTLPKEVNNIFTKRILFHLTDEEIQQMTKFLKLYFFGDEETSQEELLFYSNNIVCEYKESLAKIRSQFMVSAKISCDFRGNAIIDFLNQDINYIDMIKDEYKCSEGCAKDIWHLRHQFEWNKNGEFEIVEIHNAGVPTSTTLFN